MKPQEKGVVIVTGASRGIGREIAIRLSRLGYKLALFSNEEDRLKELSQAISSEGGIVQSFALDVRESKEVKSAVAIVENDLGPVEALINCAGVAYFGGVLACTEEEWNHTLSVNLTGYFHLIKEVLPQMKNRQRGTILNMSSVWGKQGSPIMAAYASSKFAIEGLTEGLAEEVRPFGIKVSSLVLDKVDTDFRDKMSAHVNFSKEQRDRMLGVADVADAVEYILNASNRCLPASITLKAWRW